MKELTLTQKFIKLINKKIEEIENYAIDTQENEERYIHEINCLMETKFLLNPESSKKVLTYLKPAFIVRA